MTHLYIELNTGLTEEVNSSIISKLYELAISGDLDETSDLKGRLHSTGAKAIHVAYLNANYSDLHISADKLYLTFEDAEVDRILTQKYGDGVGVPLSSLVGISTIPDNLFGYNTTIVSFDELATAFPNATSLATYAFDGCTHLESIDLKNIQNIPQGCFYDCSALQNIGNYFSDIQLLGNLCFYNCGLIELSQNDNITAIPVMAFRNCGNLISVNFPNCTIVGQEAFMDCDNLTSVGNMKPTTLVESAFNGCRALQFVDTSEVTSLAARFIFHDCNNLGPNIDIASATGKIGIQCFYSNNALVEVRNASGITEIEELAFTNCANLTTIDLSNVTTVGDKAFHYASSLSSVDLSSCLTITGEYAFCFTGLQTLSLPVCTSIGRAAFHQCRSLTSVSIPSCVTLGDFVFNNCPVLTSITLPNTLTTVGNCCFSNSGFTGYFTIPSSVTSMGNYVFDKDYNLTGYIFEGTTPPSFPNGLTGVFMTHNNQNVLLRPIYVPDSAVTAYQQAFADNANYVAAVTPISQKPS